MDDYTEKIDSAGADDEAGNTGNNSNTGSTADLSGAGGSSRTSAYDETGSTGNTGKSYYAGESYYADKSYYSEKSDMTDKIRSHIEALFDSAPATNRVRDAREELLANCLDKYADLIAHGRAPEEAYIAVISGIGDVDELLSALGQMDRADPRQENYKKRSFYVSIAVFLYILSIAAAGFLNTFGGRRVAGPVFLLLVAAATGILIFGNSSTKMNVRRPGASMLGDIQEQFMSGGKDSKLLGSITSTMWSLIVLIYLCIGFFFGWWHPGWLIFPFGAMLQTLLTAALGKKGLTAASFSAFISTLCVFVYLFISFLTGMWGVTWIIFPLAFCVMQMWRLSRIWRNDNEK